jgi:SAGA-associated factor 11
VLPVEYKHHLLQQICGVISERTGRLCTRTVKCPQHSEEDRQELRRLLLDSSDPVEIDSPFQDHSKNIQQDYHNTEDVHKHMKKKRDDNKRHKKLLHKTIHS